MPLYYSRSMSSVFRLRHTTDQKTLRSVGPIIPGIVGTASIIDGVVTIVSNDRFVRGNLLLDTGAANSAIDESLAEQLQLPSQSDTVDVHGVGGKHALTTYAATFGLEVEVLCSTQLTTKPVGSLLSFAIPCYAQGLPGLTASFKKEQLEAENGLPIIGIIGRSFLQFTKTLYDGLAGELTVEIDESVGGGSAANEEAK
jgi:hypothetical protein